MAQLNKVVLSALQQILAPGFATTNAGTVLITGKTFHVDIETAVETSSTQASVICVPTLLVHSVHEGVMQGMIQARVKILKHFTEQSVHTQRSMTRAD